jgi:hypothetical protein
MNDKERKEYYQILRDEIAYNIYIHRNRTMDDAIETANKFVNKLIEQQWKEPK